MRLPRHPRPADGEPLPLPVPVAPIGALARDPARFVAAFVALGVAIRLIRYLTHQPLWGDEAFLATSFIDRTYRELLLPLDYHQVAPPLWLWAVKLSVDLLGFNEWSLRLVPLLGGIAAVLLCAWTARLVLPPLPRLIAVAVFAVSFYPVRFAAEVKPYASDAAIAFALIGMAVSAARSERPVGWLMGLALFTPFALGFSHPAIFLGAALALWLVVRAWNDGRASTRLGTAAVVLSLVASFGCLYWFVTRQQSAEAGSGTFDYWKGAFPPARLLPLLGWLLETHTSHAFAYPIGEAHGGSALTSLLFIGGAIVLWKRGPRQLLLPLLLPFGLGLVASALGKYPYGGATRTMQYVAPSIILLAALGTSQILGRLRRPRAGLNVVMLLLFAIGAGETAADVARPQKFPEDRAARDFARAFWPAESRGAEVVCVKRDLGLVFDPHHWETGRTAVYLCHQAIYSPRHRLGRPADLDRVTYAHPLRCVLYNAELDDPAYRAWLAAMDRDFELLRHRTEVAVPLHVVGGIDYEDRYEVLDFAPRHAGAVAALVRGDRARR